MPELETNGLRPAQIKAINQLEDAFKRNRPRSLIQMATGSGKTFTACTFTYRLLKHAKASRILFVVDTKNLGEQAEQEFLKYQPIDDNRKFTELYNVQRLTSSYIASDSQVCISTIQRLYSILKGEELEETTEEQNPNENQYTWRKKEPLPVEYNAQNPMEQFDFIIIDECHRSIYNLWKQILDYYDAFLIGLTATPDKRTFGFFNENVVSEYTYEESVTDGVNVPYDVFTIETEITQKGSEIKAKEYVDFREKLSRRKRWRQLDEDLKYESNKLDKDVVNTSQIRHIIKAYKNALPKIFPDRYDENGNFEVPKSLIFAKTDSHADDIIQMVREEFEESNDFCKKLTYKIDENPKNVLNRFRNSWAPRIAVTVDMIATGTDVKPLEVLLFMRDVKSVNYFEQMKGRGTRTINFDDLKKVSRTVKHTKTHFVIIDAVGAVKSKKTDSRPLERKRSVPMKDLLSAAAFGAQEEDLFTSLANRLIRLEKQLTDTEKKEFEKLSDGKKVDDIAKELLDAYDPDTIENIENKVKGEMPDKAPVEIEKETNKRLRSHRNKVNANFNGELNQYIENVRKVHEQVIDTINTDNIIRAEWDSFSKDKAKEVVEDFEKYIADNKDEITALKIYFDQPFRRRELTFRTIKEVFDKLKAEKPLLAPSYVWEAYQQLGKTKGENPKNELVALVSLIRNVTQIDEELTPYTTVVDKNFQNWIFEQNAGKHNKFTEDQMQWLRMLKDHVANSFHIEMDDFEYEPFDKYGGVGKFYKLFKDDYVKVVDELNEILVA